MPASVSQSSRSFAQPAALTVRVKLTNADHLLNPHDAAPSTRDVDGLKIETLEPHWAAAIDAATD